MYLERQNTGCMAEKRHFTSEEKEKKRKERHRKGKRGEKAQTAG